MGRRRWVYFCAHITIRKGGVECLNFLRNILKRKKNTKLNEIHLYVRIYIYIYIYVVIRYNICPSRGVQSFYSRFRFCIHSWVVSEISFGRLRVTFLNFNVGEGYVFVPESRDAVVAYAPQRGHCLNHARVIRATHRAVSVVF